MIITKNQAYASIDVAFNKSQSSQSFYYQFPLSDFKLNPGDKVEYYLQVWDNDGVNGSKSTKTPVMTFALPSAKTMMQRLKKRLKRLKTCLRNSMKNQRNSKPN